MSRKFLNDKSNDGALKLEKCHDALMKNKENEKYTGVNTLPYYIVCRRRLHKRKKQMARQFNREILHMAMMQSYAIAGVRIDRNFSVGFPPKAVNVPDFATNDERRRINIIMSNR